MIHESTFSTIRIEDHETLQHNLREVFDFHDMLSTSLETHHDNVDAMTSEIFRDFSCEFYAITQDGDSSDKLTNHTLNATTNFLPELSEAASKMRNTATKIRHDKPKYSTVI